AGDGHKIEAWVSGQIKRGLQTARPADELVRGAGDAAVQNTILHNIDTVMNMTAKHAAQPVPRLQQNLVEYVPVAQPQRIEPRNANRDRMMMYSDKQRALIIRSTDDFQPVQGLLVQPTGMSDFRPTAVKAHDLNAADIVLTHTFRFAAIQGCHISSSVMITGDKNHRDIDLAKNLRKSFVVAVVFASNIAGMQDKINLQR